MATLTVTPTQTFISGDTVLPATLNQLAQSTVALTAGTVAVADLATATVERLLPAGAVMPFAMNSAPAGWLAANGNEYAKTGTYAALFAAISTTYGETNGSGGAGTTHFRVPNLSGIFVRGSGSLVIAGVTYTSPAVGEKQGDGFRSHTHAVTDPTHRHSYTDQVSVSNGNFVTAGGTGQDGASDLGRLTGFSSTGISIQSTGGSETSPANITLLYCIKF